MSVLIAIFQAVLQAITYIIPVSESGHAAMFHDFAGRADGTITSLTGAIHIGIALGIFGACFGFFVKLGKEAGATVNSVIKKDFSLKSAKPMRKILLMLLVSFAPMIIWLIPVGNGRNVYKLLKTTAYNNTLLDEGIFFAILGGLLLFALTKLYRDRPNGFISLPVAAAAGACSLVLVPASGLALIGGMFSVLIILGVSYKLALKYTYAFAVPVTLIMGIYQLCAADYKSSALAVILGIIFSAPTAFLAVRVLNNLIKKGYLKYVSYYDLSLGIIVSVIGLIQLIVR